MGLDDRLLSDFADSFFGYGDYSGRYWFVGMEEGGGDSIAEIKRRLEVWDERGRQELEDLPEYSHRLGVGHFFAEKPKLQSTWSKLVRTYLSAEGKTVTTEVVRQIQKTTLARKDGDTALLELLPLPSPSTNHWLYAELSMLPHLADRAAYQNHFASRRAEHIRGRVAEYEPKVVVFYGKGYRGWWQVIAGAELQEAKGLDVLWAYPGETLFVVTKHPVAMGVTNEYFQQVGEGIARVQLAGTAGDKTVW